VVGGVNTSQKREKRKSGADCLNTSANLGVGGVYYLEQGYFHKRIHHLIVLLRREKPKIGVIIRWVIRREV
jgi:hypothetical protein